GKTVNQPKDANQHAPRVGSQGQFLIKCLCFGIPATKRTVIWGEIEAREPPKAILIDARMVNLLLLEQFAVAEQERFEVFDAQTSQLFTHHLPNTCVSTGDFHVSSAVAAVRLLLPFAKTSLDQGSKIHSLHDCCLALVLSAWQEFFSVGTPNNSEALRKRLGQLQDPIYLWFLSADKSVRQLQQV
uniref:Uncharacterized protein n=1 Tax=Cucumis melo TaxID=3656 RepID=A0A9I9E8W1_CUCME